MCVQWGNSGHELSAQHDRGAHLNGKPNSDHCVAWPDRNTVPLGDVAGAAVLRSSLRWLLWVLSVSSALHRADSLSFVGHARSIVSSILRQYRATAER